MLDMRFWTKVVVGSTEDCWLWTANKNNKGYGLYRPGGTAPKRLAHRLAWEAQNGPIPDGMCILHRCDNPGCVNPAHLFPGTMLDNTRDMDAKGRRRTVSHCIPPTPRTGESHYLAKLTQADVLAIREGAKSGRSFAEMARERGLHKSTVRRAAIGQSWAHV